MTLPAEDRWLHGQCGMLYSHEGGGRFAHCPIETKVYILIDGEAVSGGYSNHVRAPVWRRRTIATVGRHGSIFPA